MSRRSLLEDAVKAVMLAPLGAALVVRDSLPNLLTDGRAEIDRQVRSARMIGTFALTRLRKEAESRMRDFSAEPKPGVAPTTEPEPEAPASASSDSPAAPVAPACVASTGAAAPKPAKAKRAAGTARVSTPAGKRTSAGNKSVAATAPSPDVAVLSAVEVELASELVVLPAPQLIGKLDGLTAAQRDGVEAAERAGRNRQTVLHKLEQLRS